MEMGSWLQKGSLFRIGTSLAIRMDNEVSRWGEAIPSQPRWKAISFCHALIKGINIDLDEGRQIKYVASLRGGRGPPTVEFYLGFWRVVIKK